MLVVRYFSYVPPLQDDRYFISGSIDGKIRLWHIPEKKVALWNEVEQKFITAMCFLKNSKFIACGKFKAFVLKTFSRFYTIFTCF